MKDRTCDTCGETKPWKAFWGVNRQPMKTCTACRHKEARRKRYLKEKARKQAEDRRNAAMIARQRVASEAKKSNVDASIKHINQKLAYIENRIAHYTDMIVYGHGTRKTENALKNQERNREYYEEVKELIMEDAARGLDNPLEYYLSNTFLLNKHGFPCIVTDADPRSDGNATN